MDNTNTATAANETIGTIAGFKVSRTGRENAPYMITGKRGAAYGLMRNFHHPNQLFAFNSRGGSTRFDGQWFVEDENGFLTLWDTGEVMVKA